MQLDRFITGSDAGLRSVVMIMNIGINDTHYQATGVTIVDPNDIIGLKISTEIDVSMHTTIEDKLKELCKYFNRTFMNPEEDSIDYLMDSLQETVPHVPTTEEEAELLITYITLKSSALPNVLIQARRSIEHLHSFIVIIDDGSPVVEEEVWNTIKSSMLKSYNDSNKNKSNIDNIVRPDFWDKVENTPM